MISGIIVDGQKLSRFRAKRPQQDLSMTTAHRKSGIPAVGSIPWGAHFCQFYRDEADLAETLIPFFKTGLETNEACLWITSGSLTAEKGTALLRAAVSDLDRRIEAGQIDIVPIDHWYTPGDLFDSEAVLAGWVERERLARERGFEGLRLSGDTIWVQRSGWNNFMDYERKVNGAFRSLKLVALCTYCSETCSASDVIDVCSHHEFALARRDGAWELLESSSLKTAKEELARLNAELGQRVDERTSELHAALRARDEFLAMLGHELRNPLAPIRTASEFIKKSIPEASPVARSSEILNRQVAHLTRLVDDLLDVARITQGHVQIEPRQVSLASVIELAAEQARPFLAQRNHAFSMALPDAGVMVDADPTRLAQVFGNLLHNAAKYTPDGGSVAVRVAIEDGCAVVRVSDTGSGLPADMLASIFELFSQLPRSLARSDGGLGIGLTLAKRVVEAHGGTIEARSDGVDKGSEFIVRLDLAPGELTPSGRALAAPEGSKARKRVMIVDDNADARESMAALLDMQGYEVFEAGQGLDALALAEANVPDVAILDIGLPDMDGYELARRLRAAGRGPGLRLVALTGYGQLSDVARAREAGFDEHILKPARLEELFRKIEGS
jgi:signal transduction histidine kinase/CheY-like chemotaxis protein